MADSCPTLGNCRCRPSSARRDRRLSGTKFVGHSRPVQKFKKDQHMSLGKPIRYLFFAISQRHIETGRAGNRATLPAVIVTILFSLNILVVIQGLMAFGMTIPLLRTFPELARLLGFGCYLIVGGLVWGLLVRNKAYTQFETEFATASERRKRYVLWDSICTYFSLFVCRSP